MDGFCVHKSNNIRESVDTFVRSDRDRAACGHRGHSSNISRRYRLLQKGHPVACDRSSKIDRGFNTPAHVGVSGNQAVLTQGRAQLRDRLNIILKRPNSDLQLEGPKLLGIQILGVFDVPFDGP